MSTTLQAAVREKVGTRHARALRSGGKIPSSLQAAADKPHLDLFIDEEEFLAARRNHQHLYELTIGGEVETALVNELAWDVFGERILHVEFRRVDRHQKTDVPVPIEYFGTPKSGLLVHLLSELIVRTTPDNIPNSVVIKAGDLEPGSVVTAGMVELPEGVELSSEVDPSTEVARVATPKVEVAAPTAAETEAGADEEGAEAPEKKDDED